MQPRTGFTLFELVMTLALVAIIVTAAVPSLSGTIARQRQSVEINELFHAVHLARKTSIVRRRVVSLCPSEDGLSCLDSLDWSPGWILFENTDRDSPAQVDPDESVLRFHRVRDDVRVVANRRSFTLRATTWRATNGTLTICDARQRIPPRALVISYTGRPRVADARPDGSPFSCSD